MTIAVKNISDKLGLKDLRLIEFLNDFGINVESLTDIICDKDEEKLNMYLKYFYRIKENNLKERKMKELKKYIDNYKIIIDETCLLNYSVIRFWKLIKNLIDKKQQKIIVPIGVKNNLIKEEKTLKNNIEVKQALELLLFLENNQIVSIEQSINSTFMEDFIKEYIKNHKLEYKVLVITENSALAFDLKRLNEDILVRKINQNGYLSEDFSEDNFILGTKITTISNNSLKNIEVPQENDNVYNYSKLDNSFMDKLKLLFGIGNNKNKRVYKLMKLLGSGGEAKIYEINDFTVAKIYEQDKINERKRVKIEKMLSKNIKCLGICYPQEILYNEHGEFVGYLMPKAQGKTLQTSILQKAELMKNFPNWNKKDIVQLCITILEKINYLHEHNIILGDINASNILVKSPLEIYLVDVDSYQIEDFPCPVGVVYFTAQEIFEENKKYKNYYHKTRTYDQYLRSMEMDYFAIAVLLFMIVMGGKNPYSIKGGDSVEENIKNMNFAYPLKGLTNEKVPAGPWIYIWSNLPYFIKDNFYNTFNRKGNYNKPYTRLLTKRWLEDFKLYSRILKSSMSIQNKRILNLYPNDYKEILKVLEIKRQTVQEKKTEEGIIIKFINTIKKWF